jgi:cobalt-zinc-cadmium efflux system membrane fusion protein
LVTAPVRTSNDAAEIEGFGHAEFAPGASYAVRAPFDGYAERVHVQVGDHVQAGALLATLRSSEVARLRAEARRLSVTLATERDGLARTERLVAENAASTREVVEARGRIAALNAELAGIRDSLSAARAGGDGANLLQLRAPREGDVLMRTIEPGERVQTSDPEAAFLIGDARSLVVGANFPERDASVLEAGAECSFVVPSLGDTRFRGHVSNVVRTIDRQTRTARVVCTPDVANDGRLRAEMVARVSVGVRGRGALVVPRSAVLLLRDERVVMVRHGAQEVERRVVSAGLTLGRDIQILSGLAAGESVVVEGAVLLDGELDQVL